MKGTPQEVFLDVAQPVSVVLNEQFTPSEHENAQGYFVQQQKNLPRGRIFAIWTMKSMAMSSDRA